MLFFNFNDIKAFLYLYNMLLKLLAKSLFHIHIKVFLIEANSEMFLALSQNINPKRYYSLQST